MSENAARPEDIRRAKRAASSAVLIEHPTASRAARSAEALAHLLAVIDSAVRLMNRVGDNCDSQVLEAHRAQLARGREWPGDPIDPVVFQDGSTNA